ncbi:hypothetical protein Tco_0174310 [Tanacetum coccineum]
MSIRLTNHTYQYPIGIAENMLVQIQKFIFPADFVILQMEEDDKVPLILGRLHTTDAIIRVKNKELNIGVGDDRIAAKFIRNFKSLAKEADESLDKITVFEEENERLLKKVVSQDTMSIVQSPLVEDTSDLQTELERTKEKFETCIIKKDDEYATLWNNCSSYFGTTILYTTDAIIRVKNKELNLGVGDDIITFLIVKAIRHSHSNDDTCFRVDVIDEVTEEELDALLDDSKPFSTTSEKISKSFLDHEFEEFMAVKIKEIPKQEEEFENSFKVLPLEGNQRIMNSIQDPPTNLVMKPLPEHLEYAFLEKDSLPLVVISTLLQDDEKKRLVFVLKKHKEAFAWKTSDILGITLSFCKHKINFEDDAKPVIQRQHRLNPNMKEVVKKEIIKLLDDDHFALKYLVAKQDAKTTSDTGFYFSKNLKYEFKNRRWAKNCQAASPFSRLENHIRALRDDD